MKRTEIGWLGAGMLFGAATLCAGYLLTPAKNHVIKVEYGERELLIEQRIGVDTVLVCDGSECSPLEEYVRRVPASERNALRTELADALHAYR